MELISPYNGSILKNNRSVINNIRFEKKRNPTEKTFSEMSREIFDFNNCKLEICSLCNKEMSFITFGKKFKCTDSCEEIKKQSVIESNKEFLRTWHKRSKSEDYQKFVLDNIEFYKVNFNEKNIVDPFFNKKIGNFTLKAFLSRNLPDNDYFGNVWGYSINCKYCGEDFRWSLFKKTRDYCQSKSCRGIERFVDTKKGTAERSILAKKAKSDLLYKVCSKFENGEPSEWISELKLIKISKHSIENSKYKFRNNYSLEFLLAFSRNPNQKFLKLKEGILPENVVFTKIRELGFEYYSPEIVIDEKYLDFYKHCPVCEKLFHKERGVYCSHDCRAFTLKSENVETFYPSIFNTPKAREQASVRMKDKILKGEWTPSVTNSYAKSRVYVDLEDKKIPCRSTWEAVFQIANPTCKFEKTRISYTLDGENKVYIVDFTDDKEKKLYEIKPESEACGAKFDAKFEAATKWCVDNGYTYSIISNDWFISFFKSGGEEILKSQTEFKKIVRNMRFFIGDKDGNK